MISRFFIDRPISAAVVSIVITLAGGLAVFTLPVTQYPEITPTTIEVSTVFPGANAKLVQDTVAQPIEQQISGVENLLSMVSRCSNDGRYRLILTFHSGTDPNIAQVTTQVRVSLATSILPDTVQRQGVSVLKKSPSQMMIINLISPEGTYDSTYLSNYSTLQIRDELLRLPGVGDVTYIGQRDYSMRVWLDPKRIADVGLTAGEVVDALSRQNVQVAVGTIGQEPAPPGQSFQFTLTALGQLSGADQFGEIILKETPPTAEEAAVLVRLRDVARIELGAKEYSQICTLDGKPSVALSIFQLPGSNALDTAAAVRAKMTDLASRFPDDLDYRIVYDTTPFIHESIAEVGNTLRDAVLLVALVILLFLQSWRATLIPLLAVPVAIIGTFASMAVFGFSLNNLSLFGLVLAIGIVVDDAIVVVENVERWLEEGLDPRAAAIKAMEEVTGPVVGVALVLSAVFIPCAFITGIVGQFFRQFALTIAVSTVLSAINSLTLSPALAALLLRPQAAQQDWLSRLLRFTLGWFFRLFNAAFGRLTSLYAGGVGLLLRLSFLVLVVYGGLLGLTWFGFTVAPSGFIPDQDKGYLLVDIELPDGANLKRTTAVVERVEKAVRSIPGVASTMSIAGSSMLYDANAPSWGSLYVILDPFEERLAPERQVGAIARAIRQATTAEAAAATITVSAPPPVDGLGRVAGFEGMVEDRGGYGEQVLEAAATTLVDAANKSPQLTGLATSARSTAPWTEVVIDRDKLAALGLRFSSLAETLQINLGSFYVNNFNRFGRTWQVNVQADAPFRMNIDETLATLKVRNWQNRMVPLASFATAEERSGPLTLLRYNMYPAAAVLANTTAGTSSGAGQQTLQATFDRLWEDGAVPPLMSFSWTGIAFMQQSSGSTATLLFGLGVVMVFLVLAALYESWLLPLAVILGVPLCLLSSVVGVMAAGLTVNIFTQIGFLVLVGLASKNAILIVEFAKQLVEEGKDRREATIEACRLRLRPILMTSLAFILGVVPLVLAEGAGWEMRFTLGIAVFSGMIGVTLFGILLTPVFFHVLQGFRGSHPALAQNVHSEKPSS